MFPCCELAYDKYIDGNNVIDIARLESAIKKHDLTSEQEKILKEPCECVCHKDGLTLNEARA